MTDLRDLIAETLAAHVDTIHAKTMTCACGWTKPVIPETLILVGHAHRLHRADAILAALDGRLLPEGGERREEWGVWWHANSADGISLSEQQLLSRDEAQRVGESRIGDYGIRGFTLVRRTHTRYETGDWSTKWERVGEPWWRPVEAGQTPGGTGDE